MSDDDLITGKILKQMPIVGTKYLSYSIPSCSTGIPGTTESSTDHSHLEARKT
jgi:hypothetical protein